MSTPKIVKWHSQMRCMEGRMGNKIFVGRKSRPKTHNTDDGSRKNIWAFTKCYGKLRQDSEQPLHEPRHVFLEERGLKSARIRQLHSRTTDRAGRQARSSTHTLTQSKAERTPRFNALIAKAGDVGRITPWLHQKGKLCLPPQRAAECLTPSFLPWSEGGTGQVQVHHQARRGSERVV